MNYLKKMTLIGLISLACGQLLGQPSILTDAWNDRQFVKQFTGSFLPLTDTEPKISESEAELFGELAQVLATNQMQMAIDMLVRKLRTGTAEEPVSGALNYTLANIYLQQGRYSDAINEYRNAIRKFPNFRRAYKNLGLALLQSGNFEDAIEVIVKSIEMGDRSGDSLGLLAYSYLNTGNPSAALEAYRQAAMLNPANQEWRIGKAEALMRTERYEEAVADFKQLITDMPERNPFYTSIANAYLALNEAEQASTYLEILRRRGEASASALGLLGDIYINEGLPSLALNAYRDALNSGGFSTSRSIRALQAFVQRGNYAEAESFLADFKAREGSSFSTEQSREVLNLEAELALAKGEDAKAAGILEKVLDSDPLNGNALMLLGNYNQNKGDFENAVYYYERAVRITDTQRDAQLQLARIYVQQKEYLKAIRKLEAALALQPSTNVQNFLDAVRAVYNRSF